MKKCLLQLFFFCMFHQLYAQPQAHNCYREQLQFDGKAPVPWAIDGGISDWETILGPGTGYDIIPFNVTKTGSNWFYDGVGSNDIDQPDPNLDFRFFSFINDDYNVYFYFRLLARPTGENSFFYFLDVDHDTYMDNGEPVIGASFNGQEITDLSLYRFKESFTFFSDSNVYGNRVFSCANRAYSIKGSLEKLFSANAILLQDSLQLHETFAAGTTENGLGVELAIPWRFFKNWNQNTFPLKAGDAFNFHVSLQEGAGSYAPWKVVDNEPAGNGKNSRYPTIFNSMEVCVQNFSREPLPNPLSYRYSISSRLSSNISALSIQRIAFRDIRRADSLPVDEKKFKVRVYPDLNCNGQIDTTEAFKALEYVYEKGTFAQQPIVYRWPEDAVVATCFIIDVSYPPGSSVTDADIEIIPYLISGSRCSPCDQCPGVDRPPTGKALPPLTYNTTKTASNDHSLINETVPGAGEAVVYPNPNNGYATVVLPQNMGKADIYLSDGAGRILQKWTHVAASSIPLQNLKPGFYLLNICCHDGTRKTVKKIIVK